jgi:hypothetical protein
MLSIGLNGTADTCCADCCTNIWGAQDMWNSCIGDICSFNFVDFVVNFCFFLHFDSNCEAVLIWFWEQFPVDVAPWKKKKCTAHRYFCILCIVWPPIARGRCSMHIHWLNTISINYNVAFMLRIIVGQSTLDLNRDETHQVFPWL